MTRPPFYSAKEIEALITCADLIEPMRRAMIAVSEGRAIHPPRFATPINDKGRMGVMYGGLSDPPIHGAKILSLYPDAPAMGLSSHQGFVMLFDSRDGKPMALFDADGLTALRTAAVSVLATQTLARPDPATILVCGAGEQAHWHIKASLSCFPQAIIRLWARTPSRASALQATFGARAKRIAVTEDLAQAISGADVIHTTTASTTAFLPGRLLESGQHINLVGASLAHSREIDDEGVARARMFTDSLESSNRESGEIIDARAAGAIPADYPVTEIGSVLNTAAPGRQSAEEITAYKSHGLIVQDLIAAHAIVQAAK